MILIKGGGDLATGTAIKLHKAGYKVVICELEKPMAVRRKVCFSTAVSDKKIIVDNVMAVHVSYKDIEIEKSIPVVTDKDFLEIIKYYKPKVFIDGTLAKKNLGMSKDLAEITIGMGPGFCAGKDCHYVVETNRGKNLGKIITEGYAEKNTGIPGIINGYGIERVLRSENSGVLKVVKDIGSIVVKDEILAFVDNVPVRSKIDGVVRGMLPNNYYVTKGTKLGDVDPRGDVKLCYKVSDKSEKIGESILELIKKVYF